jgi:AcrR family transcriptional regulator
MYVCACTEGTPQGSISPSRAPTLSAHGRPTQAERRARSRSALLESAARGLSRYGYGNLVLEEVARAAGYTRGALYHQFKDKEDLALAVIEWVNEHWMREVGEPAAQQTDPVAELLMLARGHAVFCRRDIARVVMALRLEFAGQDHPVGHETERIWETGVKRCVKLINAGRKAGSIPPGSPARAVALASLGALEGAVIALAGQAPHDELLAAHAVAGMLGIDSDRAEETPYLPATSYSQAPLSVSGTRSTSAASGRL